LRPFRFLHTADLHLDSPCVGLRSISDHLQKQLQESTFQAFERIVDLCLQYEVDFLTIAGDLYDGADRSLRAQIFVREQIKRLEEAGIQVFVIHGNHDHMGGQITPLKWSENVHVFPAGTVSFASVYREGEEIARVYGISYPKQSVTERYVRKFRKDPDAPYSIGLLHTNVGDASDHANYAPATIEELVQTGMDFWGLGHIHLPQVLRERDPVILYPGNPQGRHIREPGERGCYLVEVDGNGEETLTFLPTASFCWREWIVELRDEESEGELLDRIVKDLMNLTERENQGSSQWIVRVQIRGRGVLHAAFQESEFIRQFQDSLQTMLELGNVPVWIESVKTATQPLLDLDALRKQPNFIGDFLSVRQQLEADPGGLQDLREALRDLYGHGKPLPELDDADLQRLLQRAEMLGLQMLLEME
jgi:exonuclease SbcD